MAQGDEKVSDLIDVLKRMPEGATWYAYEGEICGIVIKLGKEELGWVNDATQSNHPLWELSKLCPPHLRKDLEVLP